MTALQQKFIDWVAEEKKKGLKDIRFFVGQHPWASIDDFILEFFAAEEAIRQGRHTPLPDSL